MAEVRSSAEHYAVACFHAVADAIDELTAPAALLAKERAAAEIAALIGVAAHKAIAHIRHPRDIAATAFAMTAYDVFIVARDATNAA